MGESKSGMTDCLKNNKIRRSLIRRALIIAGTLSVGLGILGMVLPLLPTTPFLLLAAACYARSSERFSNWLLNNKLFGNYIKNYREKKGVPLKVKVLTISLLWITIGCSAVFAVDVLLVRIILILIAIGVTIHILRIRTLERGDKLKEPFAKSIEAELGPRVLLITCGLPGTWKTETSEEVSKIKGYPILRSDLIRLEVLKDEDIFDEKVASSMDKRTMVYDEMFRVADETLKKGESVILDATFITQSLRRRAAEVAAKHNRGFVILQTHCPQEVSIARILRRTKESYESNALTEQAYLNNKKRFEEVDLDDLKQLNPNLNIIHLTVDTQSDPPEDWYIIGVEKK